MNMRKLFYFIQNANFKLLGIQFFGAALKTYLFVSAAVIGFDVMSFQHAPYVIASTAFVVGLINYFESHSFKSTINNLYIVFGIGVALSIFHWLPQTQKFYFYQFGKTLAIFTSTLSLVCAFKIADYISRFSKFYQASFSNFSNNTQIKFLDYSASLLTFCIVLFASRFKFDFLIMISMISTSLIALGALFLQATDKNIQPRQIYSEEEVLRNSLDTTSEFSRENLPFLYLFLGVVFSSTFLLITNGFSLLVGIYEYKEAKSISASTIVPIFGLITYAIAFVTSYFYSRSDKHNYNEWTLGHYAFYSVSMACSGVLLYKVSPAAMMIFGAISLGCAWQVMQLDQFSLWKRIPKVAKYRIKEICFSQVLPAAIISASLCIYLAINTSLPIKLLWGVQLFVAITAFFTVKELKQVFGDYHISNILRGDIYHALEYCEFLGNRENSQHYMALVSILKQEPRPILAKAIIKALGRVEQPEVVDELMNSYFQFDREDIKVEIIRALSHYESHHINLFLLEIMEGLVENDVFNTEEKRVLFGIISEKLQEIAVPTVLKILKQNSDNFRIIANSILVLGELAYNTDDESLYFLLSKYLNPIYSRRIRANASLYLFHSTQYQSYATACMNSLLTSGNEYDRNAVAYIAGELKLDSFTPFVLEASSKVDHQSSTLLISLLKLEHPNASKLLSEQIVSGHESSYEILKQINMINHDHSRFEIYNYIMNEHPEKVDLLLEMMSLTEKNFDSDRVKIYKEAKHRGIHLNKDKKLFLSRGKLRSVA